MENENHVDIIICGGGASGLLLAHGLTKDTAFDHLNILLIEKDSKTQNDRTWCFWEEGLSEWEELIHHRWDSASFKAPNYQKHFNLAPYHYKMIRGIDFYQAVYSRMEKAPNFTRIKTEVTGLIAKDNECLVKTNEGIFKAKKVFSILSQDHFTKQ